MLPQYRKMKNPVFHKFTVFSILENDTVTPKYVQCNNCNVIHKIYDLCRSEIIPGKDELRSVVTIDELKFFIPSDLRSLLEMYKCDLPVWEHIKFALDEKRWGEQIILTREVVDGEIVGKILTIEEKDRFSLENYISREVFE